jgi:antitoxin component of MazEF toxin-antitoxin module
MLNSYNVSYEANISKIGNAETLFIPKELAKLLHWEIGNKEKMRVKLCPNEQGEVVIKPINQWSAENQLKSGLKLLQVIKETKDTEPLPENFAEEFAYKDEDVDFSLFEGLGDE